MLIVITDCHKSKPNYSPYHQILIHFLQKESIAILSWWPKAEVESVGFQKARKYILDLQMVSRVCLWHIVALLFNGGGNLSTDPD